jgi:3-oxoacid CoA-transferase
VFDVLLGGGLVLRELSHGVTLDQIRAKTGCPFTISLESRG